MTHFYNVEKETKEHVTTIGDTCKYGVVESPKTCDHIRNFADLFQSSFKCYLVIIH